MHISPRILGEKLSNFLFSDIKISCCQETLLKIQFVIPSDSSDKHLVESYKTFIDTAPRIQVAQNTYQTDKNCDDYKACCQQYKCCEQPKPLTQDDTTSKLLTFSVLMVKNYTTLRENLSSGFSTRYDSDQPAQLQKQARVLKFRT